VIYYGAMNDAGLQCTFLKKYKDEDYIKIITQLFM